MDAYRLLQVKLRQDLLCTEYDSAFCVMLSSKTKKISEVKLRPRMVLRIEEFCAA